MKLLDRYIAKTVTASIGLVTLMLAGLQIFILFVNQLDDLGRGDFNILQAGFFVLMQVPYQVYLFFPMASLLGCLIGLGVMANHSELVVMRASGLSILQITGAVFKSAFVLIFIITLLGEGLIPKISYLANDYKMAAISGGQAIRTANGVWLRFQDNFISIGSILPNQVLKTIYQFKFNEHGALQVARLIDHVHFEDNHWQAYQIADTRFYPDHTSSKQIDSMPWDVSVKPGVLNISAHEPDEMTLKQLHRLINAKKSSKQNVVDYKLAFWQRLIQPLTTLVMMILAIPFIFGPLRSSTMGSKLLAGSTVGFGFYIINRFFGPISQVYQLPPEIAALGPTLIFAFAGLYLMRKVK